MTTTITSESMKSYLQGFFAEFSYTTEDAAYLLDAYDRIAAHSEAWQLWAQIWETYASDCNCDYVELLKKADRAAGLSGIHEYTTELLIFVCLSAHLKALYAERGISEEIYRNSMNDLRYKLEECKLVYGIIGSFVAPWFSGFFNLTRFAIGRLQFEVIDFGATYEKNGHTLTPKSRVVNVHIPRSGEPLTEEACREAYARAKAFFGAEVGDPCPFVCSSWLLYPEHEHILPKHTNTYRFFKSFDLFASGIDKGRGNLWRLFDTMEQRVDRLPADTSMRRAYVEHLKQGGKLGWGRGVLFV